MPREIERKFLVRTNAWSPGGLGNRLTQGYLARGSGCTVRVRISDDREAWLTLKGRSEGISRLEFEYQIPIADARELLALCDGPPIEKTRFRIDFGGTLWEVDVFHGANEGLVVAEVELDDETDDPPLPPWVGREVSRESRYFNSRLATAPYSTWPPEQRGS